MSGESSLAARAESNAAVGSMQLVEEGSDAAHMAGLGKQVPVLAILSLADA